MLSSFAASTCRTALAPFRQCRSQTPRLFAATRLIKYSKIVGAVRLEPSNPSLARRSSTAAGRRLLSPEAPANWNDSLRASPYVARWLPPPLAPFLAPLKFG
jgi:hypothetical protein